MALEYYFKKKNSWLINGDCLEVLANIPENSIDMVFADPPYMFSNGGFTCQSRRAVSVNKGDWYSIDDKDKSGHYHPIFSKTFNRYISNKNHSFYFKKEFMKEFKQ